MYKPSFFYPFIPWWRFGLFPNFGHWNYCFYEQLCRNIWLFTFHSLKYIPKSRISELFFVVLQLLSHVQLFCNPMDCNMPGFPVPQHLPDFVQTYVHWVGNVIQLSDPLSSSSFPELNLPQHQGLFQCVSSSQHMSKVLELQHQSFQWIFRTDFI